MSDETLHRALLFDFYAELLTAKQREYYDLYYNNDLSLGEIAEQADISRQGVWDMIRRAEKTMQMTEEKTGIIARFEELQNEVYEIEKLVHSIADSERTVVDEILQRLERLKN